MKQTLALLTLILTCTISLLAQDPRYVQGTVIGKEIKNSDIIGPQELYSLVEDKGTTRARVRGRIVSVCQKKGCWMKMETGSGEPLHISFKNYSLFMPMDLAGKEVVMEGKAWVNVTPVAELRHYAEDAGKSPAEIQQITSDKKEVRFEAHGVVILN